VYFPFESTPRGGRRASTELEAALAKLKEVLEQARAHGVVEDQLNLRLALGDLGWRDTAAGRNQLKELANDARARVFAHRPQGRGGAEAVRTRGALIWVWSGIHLLLVSGP